MSRETDSGRNYLILAQQASELFRETAKEAGLDRESMNTGPLLFAKHVRNAHNWMSQRPLHLQEVVADINEAITITNTPNSRPLPTNVYRNLHKYWALSDRAQLSELSSVAADRRRALIDETARRLFVGHTEPENPDGYAWYKFIDGDSGAGMAATTLVDMYEILTRVEGSYPASQAGGAIVSLALTEAAATDSLLLRTLSAPGVNFIEGYDGFSPAFQAATCPNLN